MEIFIINTSNLNDQVAFWSLFLLKQQIKGLSVYYGPLKNLNITLYVFPCLDIGGLHLFQWPGYYTSVVSDYW